MDGAFQHVGHLRLYTVEIKYFFCQKSIQSDLQSFWQNPIKIQNQIFFD